MAFEFTEIKFFQSGVYATAKMGKIEWDVILDSKAPRWNCLNNGSHFEISPDEYESLKNSAKGKTGVFS